MTNPREEPSGFHTVHPERDLESNWEVDLANRLEEYLLKICSGEIPEDGQVPINFAEAALLLQGSVQVYSRKVEYLYSLVLRALEFLSEKRQQDQLEHTSNQPEESGFHPVADVENDLFWGLDDVQVEAKNCLDSPAGKDAPFKQFLKPPANLVVLEGDCLDISADGGELESYLLATNDVYQDFILLDPCDAVAVDEFFKGNKAGKGQNGTHRGSSARRSFQSPTRHSGGTAHKSTLRKSQDASVSQFPGPNSNSDVNNNNFGADPPACENLNDNNWGFDMDERYSEPGDFDDEDDNDPWKPLNPHEPGNLKVKPFRKVKAFKRNGFNSSKGASITTIFPLARLHGAISPELTEIWEMRHHAFERERESQSPPLYEKLRQSLIDGGHETFNTFCNPDDEKENCHYTSGIPDFGEPDFDDLPENMCMHEDMPVPNEKGDDDAAAHFDTNEDFGQDPNSHTSLEDLCRSHLDALLASIAETENQTELAARVLTWKQKIEHNLEEQESCPPFDIHEYGDRIRDKLSLEASYSGDVMSFGDVVKGQEKYDVARSFSALLQLVNNGDVGLDRCGFDGKSICHTDVNPFHIRLLSHDKKREGTQLRVTKKRAKSPTGKECTKSNMDKSGKEKFPVVRSSSRRYRPNCKFSGKLGTISGVRCTPEGKRRRRSRFTEPVDLHSAG